MNLFKRLLGNATLFLFIVGIGFGGYQLGTLHPQTLIIKGATNIEQDPSVVADFDIFWQTWKLIKDEYLKGSDIKDKQLLYGAVDGLVKSLGDPNTNFFPPVEAKQFSENVSGHFGGVGMEVGVRNDQLVVIAPLKGSPAERGGIRSGDRILKIDGKDAVALKINEAVSKIRGEIGTKVTLTIIHNEAKATEDVTIVRETIKIPTIDGKILDPDQHIGYLRIRSFNENAPTAFFEEAKQLIEKGLNGLILDLRDDPGGYLEVAVDIGGWFLDKGDVIAIQEFRGGKKQEFKGYGNGVFKKIPVVVLTNGGSASASEILAGALRDHLGSKLIGEKTFGKGTVQELRHLKDGSDLKLTIAHWLTPKGTLIDKEGIKPDYEVKLTENNIKKGEDPQLEKAKKVMTDLIQKALTNQ